MYKPNCIGNRSNQTWLKYPSQGTAAFIR